ncbi:MAG TPA: glycosyltransferase 87 family protein [Thermoanaerobaculia bacterium]|nr:glycosyltransferase 87 family protein [Thermoanaerobaculia bacterium]
MKRALLTSAAALAAVYAVFVTWKQNERAAGLDFYIYYVNAQLASRADVDNIYSAETQERIGEEYYARGQASASELRKYDSARRRRLDNVSSPFLYTTLRWVSRDYERALQQYHVLVLAAFIAGVVLICRRVKLSWCITLLLLAALLFWYRGFEADLRVGNVNSLQLAAIGAMLWCPPVIAGVLLGLLVSFKPNLIVVALLLAVARSAGVLAGWTPPDQPPGRRRSELLGVMIGGAIAVIAATVNYGTFRVWLQWIGAANEFFHRLQTREERNVAPALSLFQQYGTWLSYAIAALLAIIVCAAILRAKRRDDTLIAGLAIMIYLISAPVVWLHYMVLVLPLAIALLRRRWTAIVSILALAMIAEEPYELLFRTPVYPHDATLITPALLALFACGVWTLASDRDKAAA